MATYVMSDIHGESDRFYAMLEKIGFSDEDKLYIIGDVIDRGPDGVSLLQKIMAAPNIHMILGNHEYMCMQYHGPNATQIDYRRWNKNGNEPTLQGLARLTLAEFQQVMDYLAELPAYMEVTVGQKAFFLVHGFPADNVHDLVWSRPTPETASPFEDKRVIIGHTPIISLIQDKEMRAEKAEEMESRGEHLRIIHCKGFIDLDCGCGHSYSIKALACLRLDDMQEFYV